MATNSLHHLMWTDLQFTSVFGLSAVTYTIEPLGIFAFLFSIGTAAVGSLLLIGAILSYGPLYRREATAVILSTAPPSVGVSLWIFEVGPVPELHLTVSEPAANSGAVAFEIRDNNSPIPNHEIETLRAGEETPLQHGQGIGLWIVYWCVQKLHGEIDFAYENGNVITVTLPALRG